MEGNYNYGNPDGEKEDHLFSNIEEKLNNLQNYLGETHTRNSNNQQNFTNAPSTTGINLEDQVSEMPVTTEYYPNNVLNTNSDEETIEEHIDKEYSDLVVPDDVIDRSDMFKEVVNRKQKTKKKPKISWAKRSANAISKFEKLQILNGDADSVNLKDLLDFELEQESIRSKLNSSIKNRITDIESQKTQSNGCSRDVLDGLKYKGVPASLHQGFY